jgi:predicted dehydrogenase
MTASVPMRILGANEDIRIGVIGVGSQGSFHARRISQMAGARLVALADPDPGYKMQALKDELAKADVPVQVDTYTDFRRLLERKDIDAVVIASCSHWHVLHSIYALQAGKHVYVEKPLSHSVWEGRQLVNLAQKSKLVLEVGIHHRSRECWPLIMDFIKQGKLGRVMTARGLCYKQRNSIGQLDQPGTPPASCDYDLWLGPAQDEPLMRPRFHYDWHWVWNTGNGDLGNQGVHQLDIARWLIGQTGYPEHIFSLGGRFGYQDAGQTPNTQVLYYDYKPIPLIFEVRNLPVKPGINAMPLYKNTRIGTILECEDGFIAENVAYDNNGKRIRKFEDNGGGNHLSGFIQAVHSNRPDAIACPVQDGHLSAALCHLGNISHRIGQAASPQEIAERIKDEPQIVEAWQRCCDNLKINEVDLTKNKATLGSWLTFDNAAEKVTGTFAETANPLLKQPCRSPWVVPEIT